MEKPYYIQRATFAQRDRQGIDGILSFDYMGSAEFEFGALPKSLRTIRGEIDKYGYFPLTIGNKEFTVFCKEEDKEEVFNHIIGLSEGKYRLKEWCDIKAYVVDDDYLPCRSDHWWDIDQNWMVWKRDDAFTEKFKVAIQPKS